MEGFTLLCLCFQGLGYSHFRALGGLFWWAGLFHFLPPFPLGGYYETVRYRDTK